MTGKSSNSSAVDEGTGLGTREKLILAAAEIFNRDGYHGTDSNRIARAAGFAPGTFYKNFRDKREVFLIVYSRWVSEEWDAIGQRWDGSEDAASKVLRLVVAHHARWAGMRRSLRALCDTDPVVRAFRDEQRAAQLKVLGEKRTGTRGRSSARADDLFVLLTFERVCDALAEGEAALLGASPRRLQQHLRDLLSRG